MPGISVLVFGNSMGGRITSCLAEDPSVDVHLFSDTHADPGRFSRCCRSFGSFRRSMPDEQLLAALISVVKQKNCDLILPVYNADIRFVALHHNELSRHVSLCYHPSPEVFEMVNDKWLLHNFLTDHKLASPKTVLVDASGAYLKKVSEMRYPAILKMRKAENALSMRSYREFSTISADEGKLCDVAGNAIVQEFVAGSDIDCSFLAKEGEILCHSMQTPALPRKDAFKADRAVKFIDDMPTLEIVSKLVKSLNFTGTAHLDMRIEKETGARMVVDFNARYWGSVCGSVAAGVNFPLLACYAALGRPVVPARLASIHYIWPAETVLRGVRHLLFKPVEKLTDSRSALGFYLKDPLVYIALFINRLRKPKSLIRMFFPR